MNQAQNPAQAARPRLIASRRHLAILCGILTAAALLGFLSSTQARAPGMAATGLSGASLYLPLLAAEWGLFLYVRAGLRAHEVPIAALVSARPLRARTLAADLFLGLALAAAWLAFSWLLEIAIGAGNSANTRPLLVRHAAEIPLWALLSLSAGFVEELVFRGYLQRQLGALLGSPWLGIAAQALLFGIAHFYQGGIPVLKILVFGLVFGAAALARRSLVPNMVAHAAIDLYAGLAAFR